MNIRNILYITLAVCLSLNSCSLFELDNYDAPAGRYTGKWSM